MVNLYYDKALSTSWQSKAAFMPDKFFLRPSTLTEFGLNSAGSVSAVTSHRGGLLTPWGSRHSTMQTPENSFPSPAIAWCR